MKRGVDSGSKPEVGERTPPTTIDRRYHLKLYVMGSTPHSARAITNIREFCETHLAGRYDLEIHEISQNPSLAQHERIIAAPTLIKTSPLPPRCFIGDMSHTELLLLGFDIRRSRAMKPSAGNG